MIGASVGMVKTPLVYCTAVNRAPRTKKTWAGRMILVKWMVFVDLLWGEAGEQRVDDGGGGNPADDDEPDDGDGNRPDDGAQRIPASFLIVFGQISGEDRDERDGEETAGEQVVEEVGDGESGDVLVGDAFAPSSEAKMTSRSWPRIREMSTPADTISAAVPIRLSQ